jgi:hypothetical protein
MDLKELEQMMYEDEVGDYGTIEISDAIYIAKRFAISQVERIITNQIPFEYSRKYQMNPAKQISTYIEDQKQALIAELKGEQ